MNLFWTEVSRFEIHIPLIHQYKWPMPGLPVNLVWVLSDAVRSGRLALSKLQSITVVRQDPLRSDCRDGLLEAEGRRCDWVAWCDAALHLMLVTLVGVYAQEVRDHMLTRMSSIQEGVG